MSNGCEKPVAYASRTLSTAQKNSSLNKEWISIIFEVKKFPQYLFGRTFRIVTDHKPLVSLFSLTSPILDSLPPRIIRWSPLLMSSYDYSIMYKPGTNIVAADAMSRLPLQENLQVPIPECIIRLMDHLDDTTVDSTGIRRRTSKDPVLSKICQVVPSGTNLLEGPLYSAFHTKRYELSVKNGYQLRGSRVIILHTFKQQVLKELHQCHPGMVKMKALARNYVWWPVMDVDIEENVNHCYTWQNPRTSPIRAPQHPWERQKSAHSHQCSLKMDRGLP